MGGETRVTAGNRLGQPCVGNEVSIGNPGSHFPTAIDKVATMLVL